MIVDFLLTAKLLAFALFFMFTLYFLSVLFMNQEFRLHQDNLAVVAV